MNKIQKNFDFNFKKLNYFENFIITLMGLLLPITLFADPDWGMVENGLGVILVVLCFLVGFFTNRMIKSLSQESDPTWIPIAYFLPFLSGILIEHLIVKFNILDVSIWTCIMYIVGIQVIFVVFDVSFIRYKKNLQ